MESSLKRCSQNTLAFCVLLSLDYIDNNFDIFVVVFFTDFLSIVHRVIHVYKSNKMFNHGHSL